MHSRYAAVFGIENLTLNQHYQALNSQSTHTVTENSTPQTMLLTEQLFADIKRAIAPLTINTVVQSTALQLQGEQLALPNPQLSTADKRALWALMSEQLDKL
ncbi:hypothetical protein [Pseudoalteromonas sp.]|uniref:hypothetical protein n=1 Tax=Pseudoalteromonas sp. TaxID=53249 RepID=UPI00356AF9F0